jgi:hypothetical protein
MPPEERLTSEDGLQEQADGLQEQAGDLHEQTAGRRRLLKALIASGGAVAASTLLPSKWSEPKVEVGMLPVHAQATTVPTPTAIPPTPTPIFAAILGCYAFNAAGGGFIGPTDTIRAYADITHPVDPSGIELRRTITLNEPSHPLNGVIDTVTGLTDGSGRFQPSDFDLNTISPAVSQGTGRLTLLWEFVDPTDGRNNCENSIDIV